MRSQFFFLFVAMTFAAAISISVHARGGIRIAQQGDVMNGTSVGSGSEALGCQSATNDARKLCLVRRLLTITKVECTCTRSTSPMLPGFDCFASVSCQR